MLFLPKTNQLESRLFERYERRGGSSPIFGGASEIVTRMSIPKRESNAGHKYCTNDIDQQFMWNRRHSLKEQFMNNNTPSALIGSAAQPSLELDHLLRGPSRRGVTSRGLDWPDYLVEEHSVDVAEREESVPSYVSPLMWSGARGTGEIKVPGGRFMPYTKYRGLLSLYPASHIPAIRTFTRSQFLVLAIRCSFLEALEPEMDRTPAEEMRVQSGFQDSGLRQLVSLLFAEAARGGICGRLYADSLAQAIAARLLYLNEKDLGPSQCETTPLPRRLLQRVIERMRGLEADLDLRTLAAETGYSQ